MPTIELTDEQAEELRSALGYECDRLQEEIAERRDQWGDADADVLQWTHVRSVLSDILELLEIA
jgi:sugar (pentulose or hexulose) kinase